MISRYDAMMAKESNGKTYWNKIGVAFASKSGSGYNVILDAMPASVDGQYKIFLFEPNNKEQAPSGGSSGGDFNRPGANRGASMDDSIPF